MSEVDPTTTPEPLEPNLDHGPEESLRDRLRREREELRAGPATLDLIVPNWETVAIRYKAIPDFEQFAKQLTQNKGKSNLVTVCKFLVRCCDCVLVRPSEDADLEPLADDAGKPLSLETRLAEYLGFTAESGSEVVMGLFSADRHPLAPATHANALVDWMRGRATEIDEALLGE